MAITVSVIKADVGSLVGHHRVHPEQISVARQVLEEAKAGGTLVDYHVTNAGDDIVLIMTHRKGADSREIHTLAWNVFHEVTESVSRPLHLYAAGQDLLSTAFSGNLKGMGPGYAEMEFEERPSEPLVVFAADKTEPGAWNLPLYRIFADPFNTPGLVIDERMHHGFVFRVMDVYNDRVIDLHTPSESYDLLALIGTPGRYVVHSVFRKVDGMVCAASSTTRMALIAGRYVGKDDPVCIVRAQHGLPAVGEILEAFATPPLVAGWLRGSHHGPLMPVPLRYSQCTRFDGPPRVVALGFQLADGKLVGPADLFDDPAFDNARAKANEVVDYLRRQGPFTPHRLGAEEMEYTTLPQVLRKLEGRFKTLAERRLEAPRT